MNPAYLFLPHQVNNHRAKLLHHDSLVTILLFLIIFGFSISFIRSRVPAILGVATNITVSKLLEETNRERVENGYTALRLDSNLSKAAQVKAKDMFAKNYWAHNAPDGKTPWAFIVDSGYQYIYAGENLARDFDTSEEVVAAWTESASHRANILSSNYKDIGLAVIDGRLNGRETTLVVQIFGAKKGEYLASTPTEKNFKSQVFGTKAISTQILTKKTTTIILGLLLAILAIDMVMVSRRRVVRLVGHNFDHIIFLGSLLPIVTHTGGVIL